MRARLESALGAGSKPQASSWWSEAFVRVGTEGARAVAELLPALARRIGTAPLGGGLLEVPIHGRRAARADLNAWRLADAAGFCLLERAEGGDPLLTELYSHGDLEERTILLRAITLLPINEGSLALLSEALRSNVESHFAAAVCDSNLPARAAEDERFGEAGFNRLILKAAFLGRPPAALLQVETQANPELSRMLQDLATEREAAGRAVWPGTNLLIAFAPTEGSVARIVGGLEHGDDQQRLAAAEGCLQLNRADLKPFVSERLTREPRPAIRAVLQRIVKA